MGRSELLFHCHHENCTRSFKRRDRLEIHLRTHTGERPFECPIPGCSISYARSQHLSRHIQRVHDLHLESIKECKVQCPQCNVELANHDCFKKHHKQFHEISDKERFYKCPEDGCEEVFRKKLHLAAHREKVHAHHLSDASRYYKCDHDGCGKSFMYPNVLRRHMKIHQGYPCDVDGCEEVLPTWSKLRKHKAKDHLPSLKCEICQSAFKTKDILVQHMKIHSSDKEPIICPKDGCDRTFLHKKNLTQHIRAFHEGKQVFVRKPKEGGERVQKRRVAKRNSAAARLCGLQDRSKDPLANKLDSSTQPDSMEQNSYETTSVSCEKPSSKEQDPDCPPISNDSCSGQPSLCKDVPCISVEALASWKLSV